MINAESLLGLTSTEITDEFIREEKRIACVDSNGNEVFDDFGISELTEDDFVEDNYDVEDALMPF